MDKPRCEYCNQYESEENKIEFQEDPYDSEINGDDSKHWICDVCCQIACDEI